MHEYDITLKSVLRRLTGSVLRDLTGFAVTRWHNVELPAVQNRRADMLGETGDGTLVHIELQSTNQAGMALRMLEYATAIHRQFGRFPAQVVLYVGEPPLRMKSEIAGPHLKFACRMVDIRSLDGERLIASRRIEDNVIAVLARLGDERDAVRRILQGIARSGPRRRAAFEELMFLAGLRKLGTVIEREARQMPILNDIMDHEVIGRERKRGIKMGIEQGLERERQIVLKMIGKRFGSVPSDVKKRIGNLSAPGLERTALRLLDARNVDELLK
jgi:hypothetical protein